MAHTLNNIVACFSESFSMVVLHTATAEHTVSMLLQAFLSQLQSVMKKCVGTLGRTKVDKVVPFGHFDKMFRTSETVTARTYSHLDKHKNSEYSFLR